MWVKIRAQNYTLHVCVKILTLANVNILICRPSCSNRQLLHKPCRLVYMTIQYTHYPQRILNIVPYTTIVYIV